MKDTISLISDGVTGVFKSTCFVELGVFCKIVKTLNFIGLNMIKSFKISDVSNIRAIESEI